ncbi:hypothetical protein FA95DRAFT_806104 [Auriscalpium vulgare]|uniref:Uncharacterized protein n=1 Tax=Auriscalpium vulgare TaxID=40419 RepID=A0ACB8RBF7_9AGAM|nr:hypothetical protein FA95DRAFT_806104 [Auriscalpium vulgare]
MATPPAGRDPAVVMFIMAPSAEISLAFDSAGHHRRVWGIEGPVVGLRVDQGNSVVGCLTWAWFSSDNGSEKEVVRFASDPRSLHLMTQETHSFFWVSCSACALLCVAGMISCRQILRW